MLHRERKKKKGTKKGGNEAGEDTRKKEKTKVIQCEYLPYITIHCLLKLSSLKILYHFFDVLRQKVTRIKLCCTTTE